MITRGRNRLEYGEFVEQEIILLEDLTWSLRNRYMYYNNQAGAPVIRMAMVSN